MLSEDEIQIEVFGFPIWNFRSGKRSIIKFQPLNFEKLLIFRSKFREIQIFRPCENLQISGHTLAVQGDLQFA